MCSVLTRFFLPYGTIKSTDWDLSNSPRFTNGLKSHKRSSRTLRVSWSSTSRKSAKLAKNRSQRQDKTSPGSWNLLTSDLSWGPSWSLTVSPQLISCYSLISELWKSKIFVNLAILRKRLKIWPTWKDGCLICSPYGRNCRQSEIIPVKICSELKIEQVIMWFIVFNETSSQYFSPFCFQ